jgi:hypothetical protein
MSSLLLRDFIFNYIYLTFKQKDNHINNILTISGALIAVSPINVIKNKKYASNESIKSIIKNFNYNQLGISFSLLRFSLSFYLCQYIYDNTIEKHIIDTSDNYIMLLQNSKYTLCPSGTGVNSIRFFEALSYGSVPILLADTIKMIDYIDIIWNDYIVVIDECDIYNINIILEKEEAYYNKRKSNCIELFNRWFHPDKMHLIIDKYFEYNMKQLTLNSINYYNIIKKNMKNNMNQYITNTNAINENNINEINIINKKIDMIQNLNELDKKKSYAFLYEHSELKNPWLYNLWLYLLKENNFNLNKIYLIDNNNKIIAFLR